MPAQAVVGPAHRKVWRAALRFGQKDLQAEEHLQHLPRLVVDLVLSVVPGPSPAEHTRDAPDMALTARAQQRHAKTSLRAPWPAGAVANHHHASHPVLHHMPWLQAPGWMTGLYLCETGKLQPPLAPLQSHPLAASRFSRSHQSRTGSPHLLTAALSQKNQGGS